MSNGRKINAPNTVELHIATIVEDSHFVHQVRTTLADLEAAVRAYFTNHEFFPGLDPQALSFDELIDTVRDREPCDVFYSTEEVAL
ncbi:hypothetical protein [Tsukamurella spumae]|uniref:Uncharacterized protein n=1 Tax=Tsukamurella spumae TaxID=44753 RepID=A0A846X5K0_9ACTN|nr:hypothetical protein [Tsukamurella spumae]NKY19462.1 hypothetical protein [Tsukamurella spumae]